MNHPALALSAALLGLAPAVGAAQTCEAIQARSDAKIRASGVKGSSTSCARFTPPRE